MKLTHPLICERCGGTIDRDSMRCPYCDTSYQGGSNSSVFFDAQPQLPDSVYMTLNEFERLEVDYPLVLRHVYQDDEGIIPMYRGRPVAIIEDKNIANVIDTYNDEIQRLQQEAADLEDVKSLRGINLRIGSIRDTIELLKKLY